MTYKHIHIIYVVLIHTTGAGTTEARSASLPAALRGALEAKRGGTDSRASALLEAEACACMLATSVFATCHWWRRIARASATCIAPELYTHSLAQKAASVARPAALCPSEPTPTAGVRRF